MNVSGFFVRYTTLGMTACKDTEMDTGLWDSLGQRWQGSRSPFFFRGSGNQLEVVRGGLSRFLKRTVNLRVFHGISSLVPGSQAPIYATTRISP